jgi:hypothetical protein
MDNQQPPRRRRRPDQPAHGSAPRPAPPPAPKPNPFRQHSPTDEERFTRAMDDQALRDILEEQRIDRAITHLMDIVGKLAREECVPDGDVMETARVVLMAARMDTLAAALDR